MNTTEVKRRSLRENIGELDEELVRRQEVNSVELKKRIRELDEELKEKIRELDHIDSMEADEAQGLRNQWADLVGQIRKLSPIEEQGQVSETRGQQEDIGEQVGVAMRRVVEANAAATHNLLIQQSLCKELEGKLSDIRERIGSVPGDEAETLKEFLDIIGSMIRAAITDQDQKVCRRRLRRALALLERP